MERCWNILSAAAAGAKYRNQFHHYLPSCYTAPTPVEVQSVHHGIVCSSSWCFVCPLYAVYSQFLHHKRPWHWNDLESSSSSRSLVPWDNPSSLLCCPEMQVRPGCCRLPVHEHNDWLTSYLNHNTTGLFYTFTFTTSKQNKYAQLRQFTIDHTTDDWIILMHK